MSFLGEIKRRKVFQVAAVYLVVAWLIMQVVDVVSGPLLLPDWFARVVILLLAIGFPIAVILSWAFDLTPQGVVRDSGGAVGSERRIESVFVGLLVLAVGFLFVDAYLLDDASDMPTIADTPPEPAPAIEEEATQQAMPNSVAVLPFENVSPNPDDAYFAIGVHEEILNQLAKIRDLNVIARTSVLGYPGSGKSIPEIAGELNVEMVMEGSVRYAGDDVRVTAQLIDGSTNTHLWTEAYNGNLSDIFAIQADIATRIAMALEAQLLPAELESIERVPTDSPEAWALYLKAAELYPGVLPTGIPDVEEQAALAFLNQALQLDPEFALAYARRAAILRGSVESRREDVERALELDPELGFGYLVLATFHRNAGNLTDTIAALERVQELSPNDPYGVSFYATLKLSIGETQEARTLMDRALELDPNNWNTQLEAGSMRAQEGDLEAAVVHFRKVTELSPTNEAGHIIRGITETRLGDIAEGIRQFQLVEQLTQLESSFINGFLAYGYSKAGMPDAAQRAYEAFHDRREFALQGEDGLRASSVFAHLSVGDNQAALEALRGIVGSSVGYGQIGRFFKGNVFGEPVLDQPEFVEVRRRLGFQE